MTTLGYPPRNAELKPENKIGTGKDIPTGMCARCRKDVHINVRLCSQCIKDLGILDHAMGKYPPRG
jgi:hypothetical protein